MSLFQEILESQKQVTHIRLSWKFRPSNEKEKAFLIGIGFRETKDGSVFFSWQERKDLAMFFIM